MSKRALLINPPVYDVQYWAEWSQPHGLLKIGSYLKQQGYETRLVDCLFPDAKRNVHKTTKSVVEFCSMREIPYRDFRKEQHRVSPNQRLKFIFGTSLDDLKHELLSMAGIVETVYEGGGPAWTSRLFPENAFTPDEVWITSIMTYWWESTVDVVELCKKVLPSSRVRIGGIYPTLAPDHLRDKLAEKGLAFDVVLGLGMNLDDERDLVVVGEIPEASWLDLDFDLYYEPHLPSSRYYHGPGPSEPGYKDAIADRRYYGPPYAILTTTRGCPFKCTYCAQRAYNLYDDEHVRQLLWTDETGQPQVVRARGHSATLAEIRDKFYRNGVRQFAFYEDNFLMEKDHFQAILEGIIEDPELRGNVHLHAPEGIDVRLIDESLPGLMRQAGFERVYLPLESVDAEVVRSWNRPHSNVGAFERAVQACVNAGFELRNMQINAFLLFGMPGEDIRNVVDSIIFASSRIGSVIPMLFTPVPGSTLYDEYRDYLFDEMSFDLHHLNGKLFPFLVFNQRRYPGLAAQDYLDIEALMFRVNAQAVRGTFDLGARTRVTRAFRRAVQMTTV